MAVDLGSVGSVYVDVGADLSGLTSQLSEISAQAEALGEQAGASIGEGITAGLSGTEGASEGLASVTNAIHETEGAAEEAVPAFEGMNESLISMAEAFGVVLVGEEVLTMFRELIQDSLDAYGNLQLVSSALTTFTGDADATEGILSQIETIAKGSIFSFPDLAQAAQKMAALGVATQDIVPALQAVSDAAMVTGNGLDAVSSALDRIYLSGTVSPRVLTQIGVSMQELADAAGVSSDEITADFKLMGSQSEESLNLLVTTIEAKDRDAAAAMGTDLKPAINAVAVAWDSMLETVGQELAPSVQSFLTALSDVIPVITEVASEGAKIAGLSFEDIVTTFTALVSVLQSAGTGLAMLGSATGLSGLTGELSGMFTTFENLVGILPEMNDLFSLPSLVNSVTVLGQLKGIIDAIVVSMGGQTSAQQAATKAAQDQAVAIFNEAEAAQQWNDKLAIQKAAAADAAAQAAALKSAIADLATAQNLAGGAGTAFVATIESVEDAQSQLDTAYQNSVVAQNQVGIATANLALVTSNAKSPTADLVNAQGLLDDAMNAQKGTTIAYNQAVQTLAASQAAQTTVVQQLTAAAKAMADAQALLTPATQSAADIEAQLTGLRATATTQLAAEFDAMNALALAKIQSYTKDDPALIAAEQAENLTRTALDATTKNITKDEGLLTTARTGAKTAATDLSTAEKLIQTTYEALYPDTTDLTSALTDLTTARGQDMTALQNLTQAQNDYDYAVFIYGENSQSAKDALVLLKKAEDDVKTSSNDVKQATSDLTTQFGLSTAQVILLTSAMTDPTTGAYSAAEILKAAYQDLGITAATSLSNLAFAADTAFNDIAASGTANSSTLRTALISDLTAEANAFEANGTGSLTGAMQIQLASLKQQQTDFLADSVTQWSTAWTGIYNSVDGAFTSMDKDITSGNFSNVATDWEKGMEGLANSVLNAFVAPAEKAISSFIATSITDLLTGTNNLSAAWTTLGTTITGTLSKASSASAGLVPGGGGAAGAAASSASDLETLPGGLAGSNLESLPGAVPGGGGGIGEAASSASDLSAPASDLSASAGDLSSSAGDLSSASSAVSDAGSGASQAIGVATSSMLSVVSSITSIATGIGTLITGIFSTADLDNIKQTLNYMHNDSTMMEYALYGGGAGAALFYTNQDILTQLKGMDDVNLHWILAGVNLIGNDTGEMSKALDAMSAQIPDIATGISSLATAMGMQSNPTFNLKVQLDSGQVMDAITTNLAQQGVRST